MRAGDCFWLETGLDRDGRINGHLFIILLDPIGPQRLTIIVPCSTIRSPKYDATCELNPGDHPFIVERSFIRFHKAKIVAVEDIEKSIKTGRANMREPITQELLERVCAGLVKSPFTRRGVKRWYHEQTMDRLFDSLQDDGGL